MDEANGSGRGGRRKLVKVFCKPKIRSQKNDHADSMGFPAISYFFERKVSALHPMLPLFGNCHSRKVSV